RARRLGCPVRACPRPVSLLLGRLYTSDFEPSERRDKRRSRDGRHFCDEQTGSDVSELVRRAGTPSTRSCQRAATGCVRSCQAKIANNMPLSPQTARLDPISDAQAENRTGHAAVEQIKAVSKIRRPAGGALRLPPQ